jgi:AraC-like DNA-binding protein
MVAGRAMTQGGAEAEAFGEAPDLDASLRQLGAEVAQPRAPDAPGPGMISRRFIEGFFGKTRGRELLAAAGLIAPGRPAPEVVCVGTFWQLCLDNINRYDDEGHGCTPRPFPKATWSTVFSAVNEMETVGDGLRRFVDLLRVVPAAMSGSIGFAPEAVHLTLSLDAGRGPTARGDRYLEIMALVLHCVLGWGSAAALRPVGVRVSGLLPDAEGSLLTVLIDRPQRAGQGLTISYARSDTVRPLGVRKYRRWASHETSVFLEIAERPGQRGGPVAVVESLRALITEQGSSEKAAARALGMSVATLQRRMTAAGTSYREVSRQVRADKLRALLATDASLDDIAVELGLSDRRSLWRACQAWLGASPTQVRTAAKTPALA